MRRNKQMTTQFILLGLLLIGVVYAILQANLQINGTAKIQANTWDIHFDNIQVNENSVSIGTEDSAATIDSNNNCKVDFEVTLSIPGDFYEFTIDVVNAGTIDGMIGELNKTLKVNNEVVSEVPDYLNYSVTYSDGVEIEDNHKIEAGTTETYLVRLEFKTDIEELPEATTIVTSLEPQYVQADSSASIRNKSAVQLILSKLGTDGIIQDEFENYRYQGGNYIKNYAYFNCNDINNPSSETCELWRIIGVFDTEQELNGEKEKRIKIIRVNSLGYYSWNSSSSSINGGYGINEWSQADLMNELNGDYLNINLENDTLWYSGSNNQRTATFEKKNVLNLYSQNMIDEVIWYTGGSTEGVSRQEQYQNERSNNTCQTESTCTSDNTNRTYTWKGKVGLINYSDYAYASTNSQCISSSTTSNCKSSNWMYSNSMNSSITPYIQSGKEVFWYGYYGAFPNWCASSRNVAPVLYLIPNIEVYSSGDGTYSNPYVFLMSN